LYVSVIIDIRPCVLKLFERLCRHVGNLTLIPLIRRQEVLCQRITKTKLNPNTNTNANPTKRYQP